MLDLVVHNRFSNMVRRGDAEIDLAEAALLIAAQEYPTLNIAQYLARLDAISEGVKPNINRGDPPYLIIKKINHYLFEIEGFRGNSEDYFDPRNSFLNQVLERKKGIPITLSLLYLEVAKRLDFPLKGVSFPGHFLIKYECEEEEIIIDPFNRGEMLTAYDCQQRLDQLYNGCVNFQEDYLSAVTKRQIITRMLTNLKGIYLRQQAFDKALDILEMLVCVDPWAPQDRKDRGMLYYRRREFGKAIKDLEEYLRLAPDAQDSKQIREDIQLIRRLIAIMN